MSRDVFAAARMTSFGDRRSKPRLEVVGLLWGSLELTQMARVVDISRGGILVESPAPALPGSVQPLQLSVDGEVVTVHSRVCHLRLSSADGEGPQYLIGYEFVSPPAILTEVLATT
jgi:hypothetical protein